jgi:hypothetical protein
MHIGLGIGIGTSNNPDTTRPQRAAISCSASGLVITLTENETLTGGQDETQYTVGGCANSPAVLSAVRSGKTIALTLDKTIGDADNPTLSYAAGGDPIKDRAGNQSPNFTNAPVVNGSAIDTTPPAFVSAVINSAGTALLVTRAEALDETSVPDVGDGAIAGTDATIDPGGTVVVSGSTESWPIAGPVLQGETVTFSYTAGTNKIRDLAHNNAANLVAAAVTNGSTQVAPSGDLPTSIFRDGSSAYIYLQYDGETSGGTTTSQYAVTNTIANPDAQEATALGGGLVRIVPAPPGFNIITESPHIGYTGGADPILVDSVAAANFSNQAVGFPPVICNYADTAGTKLWIYAAFGVSFAALSLTDLAAFTLAGTSRTIVAGAAIGDGHIVEFNLSGAISELGIATVSFTPGDDDIAANMGPPNLLQAFSGIVIQDGS